MDAQQLRLHGAARYRRSSDINLTIRSLTSGTGRMSVPDVSRVFISEVKMITSIIKLPSFDGVSGIPTSINGIHYRGSIFSPEVYGDDGYVPHCGRAFSIYTQWKKYKLRCTGGGFDNKFFDVICCADGEINWRAPDMSVRIYPLYIRIVTNTGVMPLSGIRGNVVLNIPGINRLFGDYHTGQQVCGLVDLLHYLLNTDMDVIENIPDYVLDDKVHDKLTTLFPIKDSIGTLLLEGGDYARAQVRDQVSFSCVWHGEIPFEVLTVLQCKTLRQLLPLIDTMACSLDINSVLVNEVEDDFHVFYSWIHHTDDVSPRYLHTDPDRSIPHLLYQHALANSPDFEVCGGAEVLDPAWGNTFDGNFMIGKQTCVTDTVSKWLVLDIYHLITLSGMTSPGKRVRIVGSYMEDIWVWSTDNELVCYIDLVWWILASGGGIINSDQVYVC